MLNPAIITLLHDGHTKTLKLQYKNLTTNDARALAAHLPNSKITTLDISYNHIGDQGAIAIINKLQHSNIKVLNFAENGLTNNTANAAATYIAKDFSKIRSLDLSDNEITNQGAKVLAEKLQSSHLQSLDLSENFITNQGAKVLAEKLQSSHLQSLDLIDNDITASGLQAFRNALQKCPYLTEITLPHHNQYQQDPQINKYIERNTEILDCAQQVIRHLEGNNTISLQAIKALDKQYYQAFEIFYKTGKMDLVWESDNLLMQKPNKELICNKIQQAITNYYPQITHIVSGDHLEHDMPRNVSLADLDHAGLLGEVFKYCDVADVHY